MGRLLHRRAADAVETSTYVRSPRDVLRLIGFTVLVALSITLGVWGDHAVVGLEDDVIRLVDGLSPTIERLLDGVVQWCTLLVALVLVLVPLATRRFRVLGYIVAAALLGWALMALAGEVIERTAPESLAHHLAERAGVRTSATNTAEGYARLAAAFVAVGPFVSRRWRHAGAVVLGMLVLGQLIVASFLPVDLAVAVPVGAFAGVLVLLAFGRPDRRPTIGAIEAALQGAGQGDAVVQPASVDARGSTPYFATTATGSRLFVKVLGEQERAADLLFHVYRSLRLKNVGDARPFSSLRREVEHEALLSLFATDRGVRTPHLRAVAQVGGDAMLLAYDAIPGSSVDGLGADDVDDELMAQTWRQIAILREARVAHRDLRRANLFVGEDHQPWLIDFGFSELAVDEPLLDADVAQMLASFCVVAGPQRSVSVAIAELGKEAVAAALPRLQLRALSGATQTSMKAHKGLLADLQHEVMAQCDIEEVQFVELERVNRRLVLLILALVAATYFLVPQLTDLPGIAKQVSNADWAWLPLAIAMSVVTYVGATASMAGSVPDRLDVGSLFTAQVGSSFASRLAPAGLGGVAINVRYLQKRGVDRAVAVSAVGLNTVGGILAHVSLIAVFVVWAGRDAFGSFELPNPRWFLVGLGVTVVVALISATIPAVRRMVRTRVLPLLRRSVDGLGAVFHRPSKVLLLFGGSALVTVAYMLAAYFCVEAFGGGLSLATVGAVYLVGAAVASAAPTPGGLGAVEAALIGGFVAAGLDRSVAVPAVFLFRLVTFWLPILPGWGCFEWLRRHDDI